jgi:hypothetical protein
MLEVLTALKPFFLKKLFQNIGTVVFGYTACHVRFWVQHFFAKTHKAAFMVVGTPYDATYFSPGQSAGAHGAGFEGNKNGAVGQVFGTYVVHGSREGNHFGMGCDILQHLGLVMATGYNLTTEGNDSPNGYFVG